MNIIDNDADLNGLIKAIILDHVIASKSFIAYDIFNKLKSYDVGDFTKQQILNQIKNIYCSDFMYEYTATLIGLNTKHGLASAYIYHPSEYDGQDMCDKYSNENINSKVHYPLINNIVTVINNNITIPNFYDFIDEKYAFKSYKEMNSKTTFMTKIKKLFGL